MAEGARSSPALLAGIVLLALGGLAVWALSDRPLPDPDFSTDGWLPAAGDVAAQADADRKLLATVGDGDAALDQAVEEWNVEEVRTGGRAIDEGIRRAQTRVEEAAQRALARVGKDGYRALGLAHRARFVAAMEAYLSAVRSSGEPLAGWDSRHADSPETAAMHRALGTFLLDAQRTGLVDDRGVLEGAAATVVPLLFMMRWGLFSAQAFPAEELLSPFERRTLLGWKAWANRTLSMDRRREVLERLAAMDARTPVHRVLALHYIRAQDWPSAARETVLAILDEPEDRTLAANLAWLQDRLDGL